MSSWQLQTPVCLIVFRRPEITEKVFEVIRQVKPPKLLAIADGPRPDRPGELEKCEATRKIIERVDWDCEVLKNYSDTNMGLKHRVASGLDWVFDNVEEAIILEDDCLPEPTFFRFCEELLDYYRRNQEVMVITGTNFLFGWEPTNYSYYFSRYIDCWGWATWRRAWQHFDFEMKKWPELRDSNWLLELLGDRLVAEQWKQTFEATYVGKINSWAFRWKFACWLNSGLTIIPEKNLVSNMGFNEDSTNTVNVDTLLDSTPVEEIQFPLKHPKLIVREPKIDEFTQKTVFSRDLSYLRNKMTNLWLNLTREKLEDKFQQDAIKRILNIGIRRETLTDAETNFIEELTANMSTKTEPKTIQSLLAAMLYRYPHQLPIQYDLSKIPEWLHQNYIKFLLDSPGWFQEIGEVNSYYQHTQKVVNYFHAQIFSNPKAQISYELATIFVANAKLFLYFSSSNLKDIYIKRAEIIEFLLIAEGCQLDYEFPERAVFRNKIRVGILSKNYDPHPETFATLPVYKYLNRENFEIVLYCLEASGHRLERYCYGHADAGVQLPEKFSDRVETIRNDDLDILFISPNVTAQTNAISLLALHRLARIQMVGMNSPVTTGMRHIDYFVSSKFSEPKTDGQKHYTEKLVTLDGPDQCFDFATEERPLVTTTIDRKALGIDANKIAYISGANFYKITPEVEAAWAQIIANVPNSVLILYPFNPNWAPSYPDRAFKKRFLSALAKHGVSEERLIFLNPLANRSDVKECLKLADIYLDSYPYSGMTSLIDPLQVGLPTVVLEGEYSRSRRGASLLRCLEIPDLIADSEDVYIKIAVSLGMNSNLREDRRNKIETQMHANPQFLDSRSYCAQMEALFKNVFQDRMGDALAESLRLREINFIIFPDWSQSEEELYNDFARVLTAIASHPEKGQMTLLVDTSNISQEDADMALSSMVMNLMMEEDLDVEEGPDISLVGELNQIQWETLLSRVRGKIGLECENGEAIANLPVRDIPVLSLDSLVNQTTRENE